MDPSRLDVQVFARAGASLSGRWPQRTLQRLAEGLATPLADAAPADVTWDASGEERERRGAARETWLHLRAATCVRLQCQRCLMPMQQPLAVQRSFRFVAGEAEAERLDEESEDDVLALPRSLDLAALVEDELILALPIVPRHEACPEPLLAPDSEPLHVEARPSPFAVLQSLRGPGSKP